MRVKDVGTLDYRDLRNEVRDDLHYALIALLPEAKDEVIAALENGAVLPVVEVDPRELLRQNRCPSMTAGSTIVDRYAKNWRQGAEFPPVVIDTSSRRKCGVLLEGRHRTSSAAKAGVPKILAFDLAGVRVAKTPEGLETYDFSRHRIGRAK